MKFNKKKYLILFFTILFLLIAGIITNISINKFTAKKVKAKEPIVINLLTSVHPSLPWRFKSLNKKIKIKPGEVKTIEYIVENLSNEKNTGIATFAYYPKQFGSYIRKLNCFCYDAQTLKANQQNKYSLVILIDPEVTKDSKTKNIKEITMQFTFFEYKKYKNEGKN